ncbi:hypothetical protein HOY82DRAFT_546386 [Tuber indicum]|nr:hypothetical protein HOY82DRAFT_546386 [Tuber indicum]
MGPQFLPACFPLPVLQFILVIWLLPSFACLRILPSGWSLPDLLYWSASRCFLTSLLAAIPSAPQHIPAYCRTFAIIARSHAEAAFSSFTLPSFPLSESFANTPPAPSVC